MRSILLTLLMTFATKVSAGSEDICRANSLAHNVCKEANRLEKVLASQLLLKLEEGLEFTSVSSYKNQLITYMTILYERFVLEDKIRDDGRSMKSLAHTMEIMSADSACSNEANRAFIQLGGVRQFIYIFLGWRTILGYFSIKVLNRISR